METTNTRPKYNPPKDYIQDYHKRLKELLDIANTEDGQRRLQGLSKEIDQVLVNQSSQIVRDFTAYALLYKTAVLCASVTQGDSNELSSITSTIAMVSFLMQKEVNEQFAGMNAITEDLVDADYLNFLGNHLPTNVTDFETWKRNRRKQK